MTKDESNELFTVAEEAEAQEDVDRYDDHYERIQTLRNQAFQGRRDDVSVRIILEIHTIPEEHKGGCREAEAGTEHKLRANIGQANETGGSGAREQREVLDSEFHRYAQEE